MPLDAPYVWTFGLFPGFTQTIIEVDTDDGITGIGEAPSAAAAAQIKAGFADKLIGRDPIDIQGCELACLPYFPGVQSVGDFASLATFGGIEMALWDIRGKMWDQPLYALLGGAVRKSIGFTDYFVQRIEQGSAGGEDTPEAVADYCLKMRDDFGSNAFEGKLSDPDPADATRYVTVLRERLGDDAMIRIDSNSAYSLTTARMMAPALEELASTTGKTRLDLTKNWCGCGRIRECRFPAITWMLQRQRASACRMLWSAEYRGTGVCSGHSGLLQHAKRPVSTSGVIPATPASKAQLICICARRRHGSAGQASRCFTCRASM